MKKVFSTTLLLLLAMLFGGNVWAESTTAVVRATYISGTDTETGTSFGEIASGNAVYCGFNKISNGTVALGNKTWGTNYIAYLQVDASAVPGTITGATLEGDFQQISARSLNYGVGYNSSEWKSDLTWNTADRSITAMGAVVNCAKTTVDKHISFDIKSAFAGDADKIVTILVYQTAAGGGYIKNPTVTIEYTNAATAAYTIKYMCAGIEIREKVTRVGIVGEHPVLEDGDTEDIYFNDQKYIYSNSNVSSITVNSSGTTVYTVNFREAQKYNWTLYCKANGTVLETKTGSTFEGDEAKVPYSKYLSLNGQLYLKDRGVSLANEFNYVFTPTTNNVEYELNYEAVSGMKNVVYCREAEKIDGMTPILTGNASFRSSNSAAAYAPTDITITTLPAGKYQIHVALYDATNAHNSQWTFSAGNNVVAEVACTGINFTEYETTEFVLEEESELSVSAGGNGSAGIDHIYIIETSNGMGDVDENYVIASTSTNVPFINLARSQGWIDSRAKQMTAGQAAAVKYLGELSSDDIVKLDELKYFTSVTNLDRGTFFNCPKLVSVTLPPNVSSISPYAFSDGYFCESLKTISISDKNKYFKAVDGILYSKEMDTLICYPYAKTDEVYNAPSTLSVVGGQTDVPLSLKKIIFNSEIKYFRLPLQRNNQKEPIDVYFSQTTAPFFNYSLEDNSYYYYPATYNYYIPKGSWSSYSEKIRWILDSSLSYVTTHGVYEVEGDVIWSETYANDEGNVTTCYDIDGDGTLENLKYYKDKRYTRHFNFYDKKGNIIKELFETGSDYSNVTLVNGNSNQWLLHSKKIGGNVYVSKENKINDISIICDIDNDGRKDLVEKYNSDQFFIHYQQPDGTFKALEQSATMDEEALKARSSSGGGGIRSFADGMMVKAPRRKAILVNKAVEFAGGSASFEAGACTAVDMNDDGILDLMNNGTDVLYSYDDNHYFIGTKSRQLYPCDLNGDDELDYVCYDGNAITLQIRMSGSEFTEKTLFTNKNVKQVVYKDFNHDGELDILVYINDGTNTYFVFFRNDGDLSFKRKERNFAQAYQLQDIKDVDADGLYEMLVYDSTNSITKLLRIGTDLSVTEDDVVFYYGGNTDYPVVLGDFDNDGKVEYNYIIRTWESNKNTYKSKYGIFSTKKNTEPEKMEKPMAILDAEKGRLRISWQKGTDAETSACDLTYELRIGTQPASGDVLFGASLADGRRRTLEEGNMGRHLSTLFNANSLTPGKYYISVQAIDGGGRGGAWSDDFVYEHQLTAPIIVLKHIKYTTTADTLELDVKAPIENATYKWELSEGKVIEQNGSNAKCVFEQDGEHTITLAMTVDGRTLNAEPKSIDVAPAKYVERTSALGYVDINQDGYPEGLGYVNDGKGNLSKVLLSYVTDIPSASVSYMDYDMDGYVDAIAKNNVYINAGDQDNDFEIENQTFDYRSYPSEASESVIAYPYVMWFNPDRRWFDANNDGHLDNSACFNDGTNIVWRYYHSSDDKYALCAPKEWDNYSQRYVYHLGSPIYDVNRDGFIDIVDRYDRSSNQWYVMYKDSTANISYTAPQLLFEKTDADLNSLLAIEDINNDGYVDLLFSNRGEKGITVVKGQKELPYTDLISCDLPVEYKIYEGLHDYNNDGYMDLLFYGSSETGASQYYLYEFGPDFTGKLVKADKWYSYISFLMVQKDGGYPGTQASNIKNLPPSAPVAVAAKQTKEGLLITWSDAQDDHTPAMQMRYNISVKRKGKRGAGSFVISPLNGLKDAATICGNVSYWKSTQMLVPASVLTAGETYEIQVQSIDLWNQHSPMTKAVEFTMMSNGYIEIAEQVAVGKETSVKFVGTQASNYSLNAGADGTIVKDEGNGSYIVKWNSEGVKDIMLTAGSTTVKTAITVVKPVDLTFSIASRVFAGVPMVVNVSDEMAAQPKNIGMRIVNNNNVKVNYLIGSKTAVVTFPEIGTYELEAYSTDPIKGNSYKQTVEVSAEMPAAVIEQVDVDSETGFYTINWDTANLPVGISKVAISKEGKTLGTFNNLAIVDASTGRYVDKSSTPAVMASRYRIQLVAENGQTSEVSAVHKPLHVMIAKAAKGYNLIWDNYEGLGLSSYNILRGSSPNNMQTVAQVASSINSFTDTSAPSGTSYYAVTFSKATQQAASRREKSMETTIGSNVISTEEAVSVQQAQSIELIVLDDDNTLSDSHPELQLYYMLLPTYTTISKVSWEIVSGADIATIDANGKLLATGGSGTVTVRVRTIDGSELSDEISIVCTAKDVLTDIHEIPATADSETVLKEIRYFTLDGKRIDNAVEGQVVIEWSIYSNGQISVRKYKK